jgi:hypothetical protein
MILTILLPLEGTVFTLLCLRVRWFRDEPDNSQLKTSINENASLH